MAKVLVVSLEQARAEAFAQALRDEGVEAEATSATNVFSGDGVRRVFVDMMMPLRQASSFMGLVRTCPQAPHASFSELDPDRAALHAAAVKDSLDSTPEKL